MAKRKKRWKLLTLITAVLILIVLMFLWLDVTPKDIYKATFKTEYTNASIIKISQEDLNLLSSRYKSDREEFIYCVYGSSNRDSYTIEELRETSYTSDGVSLSYDPCNNYFDYLGTIHSHPSKFGLCEFSTQDAFTFGAGESEIDGIICGEKEIAFFERDGINEPIGYEIIGAD